MLYENRFKLLALLPIATGAALALGEAGMDPATSFVLGALGFFVTIGIIFYDQRNTGIYEKQIRIAKLLELRLGFEGLSAADSVSGPFLGRPGRSRNLFGRIQIWHDRGLAMIYSAALGVWAFMMASSSISLVVGARQEAQLIAGFLALGVTMIFWRELHRLDSANTSEFRELDQEIQPLAAERLEEGGG